MFIFQSDCFSDKLILDSGIVSSTWFWDYWKQWNYSFFGSSCKRASNRLLRVFWKNYDLLSLKKWTAISCDHLEQIYKLMIYPRTTRVILDLSSQFTIEVFCVCLSRSTFFSFESDSNFWVNGHILRFIMIWSRKKKIWFSNLGIVCLKDPH